MDGVLDGDRDGLEGVGPWLGVELVGELDGWEVVGLKVGDCEGLEVVGANEGDSEGRDVVGI